MRVSVLLCGPASARGVMAVRGLVRAGVVRGVAFGAGAGVAW
ncbi:hypothetical protein [Streptomyces malaysiensis]|nr:hypothetical protein [Streptomyces malaysiensis]